MLLLVLFVYIIVCLILFVLLLVILILVIPFEYQAKAVKTEAIRADMKGSWLFGSLSFRLSYCKGEQLYCTTNIFGITKSFSPHMPGKKKKDIKEKKERRTKQKNSKSIGTSEFLRPYVIKKVLITIAATFKRLLPENIDAAFRYGFDDPYYTGMVSALTSNLNSQTRHHTIMLEPVFEGTLLEGYLKIKGSIVLAALVIPILKLVLSDPFKYMIFEGIRKRTKRISISQKGV
jgi:hypothetical protein